MKLYFRSDNDENCYTKKEIIEQMKEDGLTKLKIFEAKMQRGTETFFCSSYDECGIVGFGCGKNCEKYKPRNGKNGRCSYSTNPYEQKNKFIIINLK